jgi:hypothetical protein
MAEDRSETPNNIEPYKSRLTELLNRMKIAQERRGNMLRKLPPGTSDQEWFNEAAQVFRNAAAIKGDFNWITAMQNAGLPHETILEVWEAKDTLNLKDREENDPKK